jgi:hypothetical protein
MLQNSNKSHNFPLSGTTQCVIITTNRHRGPGWASVASGSSPMNPSIQITAVGRELSAASQTKLK